MSFIPTILRPRASNRARILPTRPRWTASGFRRTNVRSAVASPGLLFLLHGCGRMGLLLARLALRTTLHGRPARVEPRFEHAAAIRGVLPCDELALLHARDDLAGVG